ncbi:GspE/PulE family protein [Hydrogenimonas cancrithermarum]|uniref:Type IV pilin n=1 Tax=Hydrogenimonas cancrithermarum TaxID=2993563 RepID=A0ABM8FM44_9BACT|nr:GspE/PulE family protein [Hydrogenimonas cancrithermarum]BDY12769.1 type IV pilin [Hydrogenimonas cancrithermarum]
MAENKPIGKLLEEAGYINEEQIEVALAVQKVEKKFFGEILQELDFVSSSEVAEVLALQYNVEYIDLDTIVPETEALKSIPHDIALSKTVLPLEIRDGSLVVATQDVNDLMLTDFLQKTAGRTIEYRVADKRKIIHYAQIYYYQLENPIEKKIAAIIEDVKAGRTINIETLLNMILNNAIKDKATDIHITPQAGTLHIFYRLDGVLKHYYALPVSIHQQFVAKVKIASNLDIAEQRKPQDGGFTYTFLGEEFDLRISTLPTNYGENIVMRLLEKSGSLFSLHHLGFSEENKNKIEYYFSKPYGIILVTGPTGSGKTTTLYSALRKVDSLKKNILTIEDPIEYKFAFIKQTQANDKAGYTFDAAIRAFMRQDPDVMLVGEIRDPQTAELAIRASITGHLVLTTLHTNDAVGAIPRLIDLQVPPYLVGSGLLAILAQRLVRKLCRYCKHPVEVPKADLVALGIPESMLKGQDTVKIYEAVGCEHCRYTGYAGREAIIEILEVDKDIEAMIAAGESVLNIQQKAISKGMHLMKEDGFRKVLEGVTTIEEVYRVVT